MEVQHGDGVSRAVAGRDCRAAKDLVWVRPKRGVQVGKALLHNGWKKRRHHSGLQRILRVGLLSGCAAEGPEEAAGAARAGAGSAGDEVHQRQGDCDEGGHHQGLRTRGRGGREGRNEGRDEAPRASRARGVEGEVPQRSAVQARVRGADAGSAKGIPVSLRRREAVWDADRADREGDACNLRRTRVPGAAIDRETVLWRTAANPCRAWRLRVRCVVSPNKWHVGFWPSRQIWSARASSEAACLLPCDNTSWRTTVTNRWRAAVQGARTNEPCRRDPVWSKYQSEALPRDSRGPSMGNRHCFCEMVLC